MKAHINGITIEGTPQEIMEYQRLHSEEAHSKPLWGKGVIDDLIPLQLSPMSKKELKQHVKNLIRDHEMY